MGCYPRVGSKADFWGTDSFVGHIGSQHRVNLKFLERSQVWRCRTCDFQRDKIKVYKTDQALCEHLVQVHGLHIGAIEENSDSEDESEVLQRYNCYHRVYIQDERELSLRHLGRLCTFLALARPWIVEVHSDFLYGCKAAKVLQRMLLECDNDIVRLVCAYACDARKYITF